MDKKVMIIAIIAVVAVAAAGVVVLTMGSHNSSDDNGKIGTRSCIYSRRRRGNIKSREPAQKVRGEADGAYGNI